MRILITNDDGINAPGLAVLEKITTSWQARMVRFGSLHLRSSNPALGIASVIRIP